jgi:NADH:ubiquinone oxidoreductase subunit 6 (subunit J)
MFDLFTVLVPLFSGLALLTLLVLKLALKDNVTLIRIFEKNQDAYQVNNEQTEESPVKNILKYLLLNFTPIEICAVRRAKHKLSLFLSLAIILIGTSFVSSPFAFAATGTVVYFLYFFLSLKMTFNGEAETEENKKYREKYLQIVFAVLTLVLNFIMIARVYKNYHNTTLTTFLGNAGISIVLDNFLVRPVMVVLIGLPLSKSSSIQGYISECQKEIVLLEIYDVIGEKEMLLRPKKMFSPSKIPKSIPLDFEIEPRPIEEPSRNEDYDRTYDLLRKIKKEKLLPPITLNLQSMDDHSLNSLLNSTKK